MINAVVVSLAAFQSTLPTRGSDRLTSPMMRGENVFQSTLPTRGSDYKSMVV